jgi:hypothetical protein
MASNKDLIKEAEGLAEELGLEIVTVGLNNKALAALVSDLKAKKKDVDIAPESNDADIAPESNEESLGPVIAKGKSLTSLKGILCEGVPVTPEHFVGGQETFDHLKRCGFIE